MKHQNIGEKPMKGLCVQSIYVCIDVYTYAHTTFWMLSDYIPVRAMMYPGCLSDWFPYSTFCTI